jgi:hypothetical protein
MKPSTVVLSTVAVIFLALIAGVVTSSLRRPSVEGFVPTAPEPQEVGDGQVGPRLVTVDATAHDAWIFFDFSRGSVVEVGSRRSLDWDIAFQRHRIISNGGESNPLGRAGVADLGDVDIDGPLTLPAADYLGDEQRGDTPRNRRLEDWYDYSWTSHLLEPANRTYAIRTADGYYAVLRFVSYYCPAGRPGCVSFRYRYRGDGERRFERAPETPEEE